MSTHIVQQLASHAPLLTLKSRLKRHRRFLKEMTVYTVQTQGLTVLGLASAIILPRLLSQETYGLYGFVFSFAGLLTMCLSGGVVPLVGNRLLQGPLADVEREELFVFIRRALIGGVPLAALACIVLSLYANPRTGWYVFLAFVAGQWLGYLPLLYYKEVRHHALRAFIWLDTSISAARLTLPLLGVLIWKNLSGYFVGLLVACALIPAALLLQPSWRARLFAYAQHLATARMAWRAYMRIALRGIVMMAETATGTLYQSIAILYVAWAMSLNETASIKVLMGFLGAAFLAFMPLSKWLAFHLPQRLRTAAHPQREFLRWTALGGVTGVGLYALMLLLGPALIPIVYGAPYASAGALVPSGGLIAIVAGCSLHLGIISKMYRLVGTFVLITSVTIGLGLLYLASPWHPTTLPGIALFYALWSAPSSVMASVVGYRRLATASVTGTAHAK
jgi:hypothetical protein